MTWQDYAWEDFPKIDPARGEVVLNESDPEIPATLLEAQRDSLDDLQDDYIVEATAFFRSGERRFIARTTARSRENPESQWVFIVWTDDGISCAMLSAPVFEL